MKQWKVKIDEALDWNLYKKSLRWELTDRAEQALDLGETEGDIGIAVEGDEFVCAFTPEP